MTPIEKDQPPVSDRCEESDIEHICTLFKDYCRTHTELNVPNNYIKLSVRAMENLKDAGHCNVVYSLCKAVGTKQDNGSDTLLSCKQMPMGLIEYCVQFFTSNHGVHNYVYKYT